MQMKCLTDKIQAVVKRKVCITNSNIKAKTRKLENHRNGPDLVQAFQYIRWVEPGFCRSDILVTIYTECSVRPSHFYHHSPCHLCSWQQYKYQCSAKYKLIQRYISWISNKLFIQGSFTFRGRYLIHNGQFVLSSPHTGLTRVRKYFLCGNKSKLAQGDNVVLILVMVGIDSSKNFYFFVCLSCPKQQIKI